MRESLDLDFSVDDTQVQDENSSVDGEDTTVSMGGSVDCVVIRCCRNLSSHNRRNKLLMSKILFSSSKR